MTLHQLPEQNHSQCEYGDPNRKESEPQQRALDVSHRSPPGVEHRHEDQEKQEDVEDIEGDEPG